ncbi:MAG: sigma-70 family RNA polymerase sigma factor [Candidatus Rokubacteria bacterium]|nr:sigma-70 family RNA polymerase sigma factor [Candidatus Rokubacteria bacterium]
MERSDEALLERVARRDDDAFDVLVARYRERAHRIAWSILRNAEDARDLSQEAFIRLYRSAGSFRGSARVSTWFYRILVNLCLDHRRRRRWWDRFVDSGSGAGDTALLDRLPAAGVHPDDDLARGETMSRVWSAVDRLSSHQRAAVVLQLEGLPTSEIAEALGCSEATVRVHLHRALAALRKSLRET